jgi:hypothetical protein
MTEGACKDGGKYGKHLGNTFGKSVSAWVK